MRIFVNVAMGALVIVNLVVGLLLMYTYGKYKAYSDMNTLLAETMVSTKTQSESY